MATLLLLLSLLLRAFLISIAAVLNGRAVKDDVRLSAAGDFMVL
jgi:hypothetical protein